MAWISDEEIEKNLEALMRLGLVKYYAKAERYLATERAFKLSRREINRLLRIAMDENQKTIDQWLSPLPLMVREGE